MDITSPDYKDAFCEYLRRGTPIELSLKNRGKLKRINKQKRTTTHYIWRTQGDSKVRDSHAANNGKVFAWDNPPATGHPGEDYGCRCIAEPYVPEIEERFEIKFHGISDAANVWQDNISGDFQDHYFNGNGEAVRLRDTGHLQKVVNEYWRQVGDRLPGQIADAARNSGGRYFAYDFESTYPMKRIVYDLGDTTIGGFTTGHSSTNKSGALQIVANCAFYLTDKFEDPFDIGLEMPNGTIYSIFDNWHGLVRAIVHPDRNLSKYRFDS